MSNEVSALMEMNGAIITPSLLDVLKSMQDDPGYITETIDCVIREKIMSIDLGHIKCRDIEILQNLTALRDNLAVLTNPKLTQPS